jgi:hypothetical protein
VQELQIGGTSAGGLIRATTVREKLTMAGSNLARRFGRKELTSDRRGSADVVPFRPS